MSEEISLKTSVNSKELFAFRNQDLPVKKRVALLINAMTLEEKAAQMMGIWKQKYNFLFGDNDGLDFDKISRFLKHGIGQIGRLSDTFGGLNAVQMAQLANSIQT